MGSHDFNNQLIVKKSPVVIVKTFLVLQLTAVALFFLAGIAADYGEIYEKLALSGRLSFHVAQAAGIFFFETALVFYIFFQWHKEYYNIENEKIIHSRGIIFRKKTVIPLGNIVSIDYRQGPLGRLTKYGTVDLKSDLSQSISMDHLPDPQYYANLIAHFKNNIRPQRNNYDKENFSIKDVIATGENEQLEFKVSFRWDINQNKVNKNLEKMAMKTIAAFLNSQGGKLILGVSDSGQIVGLENDYKSLPKASSDGFQNHFTNIFHQMIGPEFRQFVNLNICKIDDKECCVVMVSPANKPAYLKLDSLEEFYIRTGNGTTSLKLSEMASYVDSHWKGRLI